LTPVAEAIDRRPTGPYRSSSDFGKYLVETLVGSGELPELSLRVFERAAGGAHDAEICEMFDLTRAEFAQILSTSLREAGVSRRWQLLRAVATKLESGLRAPRPRNGANESPVG
jgi:hypothetical protein